MSANFEAKKALVEEIKEKIQSAKSIAFVDYRGLTAGEDTKMRRAFREAGADYKVYKNRLMLKALEALGISGCEKYLEGTTAVAFSMKDEVGAAKVITDTIKETKKMEIKFGILNGTVVDSKAVEALAKLPSKEVLIAQLLGMLNAPATNLARVLNAPTEGLAIALNAVANKG